jgi:hypothetical protein
MADAASSITTPSQLVGVLKPIFGRLVTVLPDVAILQKLIGPLSALEKTGDSYWQPVQMRAPGSITFAGSAGDGVTLAAPHNSVTALAKVVPYSLILRDRISYAMLDRAGEGGKQAFISMSEYVGKSLTAQARRVLEMGILCGQSGLGTVSSYNTDTVTLSAASVRMGVLAMLEGQKVDVYQSDLATLRTSCSNLYVTAVDLDAQTITLAKWVDATGASTAVPDGTPAATDVIFLAGSVAGGEQMGLKKQVSATTGTVFNIDKAKYSAWRGNNITGAGMAGAGLLLNGVRRAIERGLQGEVLAVMSPKFWAVLNSNVIAKRLFDDSYSASKAEEGSDEITFRGNGVVIRCISHPFQADGEVLILPKDGLSRIGSVDLSFKIPNSPQEYMQPIPDTNTVEYQCRSDSQVFLEMPSHAVAISGVTY